MTSENYFSWRKRMQLAFLKVSKIAHITRIIEQQAEELEFDFFALFIRHPVPFTRPKTFFTAIILRGGLNIIYMKT